MDNDCKNFEKTLSNLVNIRKFDEGIKLLHSAIEAERNRNFQKAEMLANLYNWLGLFHYLAVEFDAAVECYNKAILMKKTFSAAYYNRGTVRYRLGDAKAAIEDFEMALRFEPSHSEYLLGLQSSLELKTIQGV